MKITSIEIHPENSDLALIMSLEDPKRANPYNVKAIDGLDANDIIAKFYGSSIDSSKRFYNLSVEKRDVVIKVQLNPDFTIDQTYSDLRDYLSKMIFASRTGLVEIWFKNGVDVVAILAGFVSKFESPTFTKTPEVQITIKPNDTMLKAPNAVSINVAGLDPALTIISDGVSTAPHGFTFVVTFTANSPNLKITNPDDSSWSYEITPSGGFLIDDVLSFSSEINNRYIYLTRSGVVYFLADAIIPGSIWPILFPGSNKFSLGSPSKVNWNFIGHYPTYWGI